MSGHTAQYGTVDVIKWTPSGQKEWCLSVSTEVVWDIPEPLATLGVPVDDETSITLRRHGNPEGPRLVLSHGNGLAIDLYYPFWSLLTEDFDLVVYDLRNHGWNSVSSLHNHTIPTMIQDHEKIVEAIDHHFGEKPKVGVFHSVSSLATLLSTGKGSEYAARVLFDPPLCQPGRGHQEFEEATSRLAAMTRRRTYRFEAREDLARILPFAPNLRNVVPGVFDLFTRTTLRESRSENGYELCCPPEYEAQFAEYAGAYAVLVDFDTLLSPTKVIGADPTLRFAYLPTLDLTDVSTVDYDFLPDTSHFLQLEQPENCVKTMLEFLETIDLG